jgi:hypothetical protein
MFGAVFLETPTTQILKYFSVPFSKLPEKKLSKTDHQRQPLRNND